MLHAASNTSSPCSLVAAAMMVAVTVAVAIIAANIICSKIEILCSRIICTLNQTALCFVHQRLARSLVKSKTERCLLNAIGQTGADVAAPALTAVQCVHFVHIVGRAKLENEVPVGRSRQGFSMQGRLGFVHDQDQIPQCRNPQ